MSRIFTLPNPDLVTEPLFRSGHCEHLQGAWQSHRKGRASSLICLSLLFIIVSCASAPPPKKEIISPEAKFKEIESASQVKAMNDRILMAALSSKKDPYRDYKIGPEDLLEISVFEEEKLNKTVRVSSQGNISLPLLGILRVKGLTASELEKEIRDLLAEKYLQDPNVGVFIKEYRSQRISVIGAVEKPGVFEVTGQKTILDMLAMAGGLKVSTDYGAGQLLFVIRPAMPSMPPAVNDEVLKDSKDPKESKDVNETTPKTFVIDLEDLLVKGDLSLNLTLNHGDILNIPISGKIFVGGEVKGPGGFPLKGKNVTVSQAIAMAGGLLEDADGAETKIFRYIGKGGEREAFTVNVYAIQKGESGDPYLKENDIIIVPKHGMKAFLVGLRDTVKGLMGFGMSFAAF